MAGKLHGLGEVVKFCQEHDLPGEVVGRWVWVRFPGKPSEEVRFLLREAGFHWSGKRKAWAHDCGVPSKPGHGDPRWKYGVVSVSQFNLEDEKGVA